MTVLKYDNIVDLKKALDEEFTYLNEFEKGIVLGFSANFDQRVYNFLYDYMEELNDRPSPKS